MILFILLLCLLLGTYTNSQRRDTASNATHVSPPCQSRLKVPYTLPGRPGRDGRDGKNGVPGQDGGDGVAGPPGPPGISALDELDNIREIIRLLAKEELHNLSQQICNNDPVRVVVECASATVVTPTPISMPSDTMPCPDGNTADNPADSCRAILECNPSAPSGYYWIGNRPGVFSENSTSVYCYMEADKCGVRGVMRVAHIDMKNTSVNCPTPLTQYELDSGRRLCASTNTTRTTCDSVIFPTNRLSYHHVCGRAVGFSFHHPCGFWYCHTTINNAYVSGLSITYGPQDKRKHIWTYAGGFQERFSHFCNCPCARFPGACSPPFVCQDFYCETATLYPSLEYDRQWYTNNTLWDGEDCNPGSHCCNNALAPWFRRTLQETTTEDIEVRWCVTQQVLCDRVGSELWKSTFTNPQAPSKAASNSYP